MPTLYEGVSTFLNAPPFQATEERLRTILPEDAGVLRTDRLLAEGTNYILCYTPRSGSTHLCSLLQNSNIMGKPADFFNLDYMNLEPDARQLHEATGGFDIGTACKHGVFGSVDEYLQAVAAATRTRNGVFGLKVDLYQASILMRRGLFCGPRVSWKYIYVTREDILMQAISYYTAIQTGRWSSLSPAEPRRCDFDERRILGCMRTIIEIHAGWEYAFGLFGIRPLRLSYEELEADPRDALERVIVFAGVPFDSGALPMRSAYRKQRTHLHGQWAATIRARAMGLPDASELQQRA